jgi:peroxiredoxin
MAGPTGRVEDPRIEACRDMTLLSPGSTAPDFSAEASDGERYHLRDLLERSRVLLVFYPGNNTPG